jgi:hypothetical protein
MASYINVVKNFITNVAWLTIATINQSIVGKANVVCANVEITDVTAKKIDIIKSR